MKYQQIQTFPLLQNALFLPHIEPGIFYATLVIWTSCSMWDTQFTTIENIFQEHFSYTRASEMNT